MSSSEIDPPEVGATDSSSVADIEHKNAKETSTKQSVQRDSSGNDSIQAEEQVGQKKELITETRLLRDTLDLLWNQTAEQRKLCHQLEQENEYLQEYISNLMTSSNVLDK